MQRRTRSLPEELEIGAHLKYPNSSVFGGTNPNTRRMKRIWEGPPKGRSSAMLRLSVRRHALSRKRRTCPTWLRCQHLPYSADDSATKISKLKMSARRHK